jgi:hypothetical protein
LIAQTTFRNWLKMIIIAAHLQFFGISPAFEAPNDLETLIVLQFMESGAGSGQPVVGARGQARDRVQ